MSKEFRLATHDFHYSADVQYEEYHACHHGSDCCDDDYCRCGKIENARVETAPNILSVIPKQYTVWDRYCFERLVNSLKPWETDSYDISVCGGYYGEEIRGVYLNQASTVDSKMDHVRTLSNSEKIRYVLQEEYGYLLESLKDKDFEIRKVHKDQIRFGQKDHYNKLDKEAVERYKNYDIPRGIVAADGDFYRVIDGYHRMAAGEGEFEVFCVVE